MVDYTTVAPGVHVEEIVPAGPIAGAGTSVAALIGTPARLPSGDDLGRPVPVTSWNDYKARLGEYGAGLDLPFGVARDAYSSAGPHLEVRWPAALLEPVAPPWSSFA